MRICYRTQTLASQKTGHARNAGAEAPEDEVWQPQATSLRMRSSGSKGFCSGGDSMALVIDDGSFYDRVLGHVGIDSVNHGRHGRAIRFGKERGMDGRMDGRRSEGSAHWRLPTLV